LAGLTKSAALDYARQGIRVNAIAPGATRSEMLDRWLDTEAARERVAAAFPMNGISHPDDMARAALLLLTDEMRWTTGVILPCEAGMSAGWQQRQD
jgi:NAD(P)-dependent dehydrogenase (short-subunit alcohol dehydrogenase family)